MTSSLRVLDIAEAMRTIFLLLDFSTLEKLLTAVQLDDSGRTYLQDSDLWKELTQQHFKGPIAQELEFLALPQKHRVWQWTDRNVACAELQQFLRSGDELAQFKKSVSVVRGDIGRIQEIGGMQVDGLAFPTNSYLTNHHVGAANAIFKRAGQGLTDYVRAPGFEGRRDVGSAVPTPAFDAGVKRLIHCVGPRISQQACYELLYRTFENVMHTALAEDLQCVAVASISTGAMGIPAKQAALVALQAIQKFIRANHWEGKIAIVCVEHHVLDAFEAEYKAVIESFNASPALPSHNDDQI